MENGVLSLEPCPLGKAEPHQWSVTPCGEVPCPQGSISSDSGNKQDAAAWAESQADSSARGCFICSRSKPYCNNRTKVSWCFDFLSLGS